LRLNAAVSQHLRDLGVLLPILTENKLALVVVVLVLSTSPVLTTLSLVLDGPATSARLMRPLEEIAPSA
jgi:hypothetical protein